MRLLDTRGDVTMGFFLTGVGVGSGSSGGSCECDPNAVGNLAQKVTTLETSVGQVSSKVTTLEGTVAGQSSKITTLESDNRNNKTKITTLEGEVTKLKQTDATHTEQIEGLHTGAVWGQVVE